MNPSNPQTLRVVETRLEFTFAFVAASLRVKLWKCYCHHLYIRCGSTCGYCAIAIAALRRNHFHRRRIVLLSLYKYTKE